MLALSRILAAFLTFHDNSANPDINQKFFPSIFEKLGLGVVTVHL